MGAVEQPVHVDIDEARARHHGRRVAQNQQQWTGQRPVPLQQFLQQAVEDFNGRGFVAMDAGGNDQGLLIGVGLGPGRCQLQHAQGAAPYPAAVRQPTFGFWQGIPGVGQSMFQPVALVPEQLLPQRHGRYDPTGRWWRSR